MSANMFTYIFALIQHRGFKIKILTVLLYYIEHSSIVRREYNIQNQTN